MTRDEMERAIEQSYHDRRCENVDACLRHFAEDGKFRIVANEKFGDLGRPLKGYGEIRPFFERLFADWDWKGFEIQSLLIDGNRAAVHCAGRMYYTPTEQDVEMDTLDLLTFEDGKIVDFVEFFDTDLVAQVVKGAAVGGEAVA